MKQQEETYEQELALESEIEKLRLQLAQTQVQPPSGWADSTISYNLFTHT